VVAVVACTSRGGTRAHNQFAKQMSKMRDYFWPELFIGRRSPLPLPPPLSATRLNANKVGWR
jgi:hypothetical protein